MAAFLPGTALITASESATVSAWSLNALNRGYNKRTNSGWFQSGKDGVCNCGKPYTTGNVINYLHGKISGCLWCCSNVAPTATDLANYTTWLSATKANLPAAPTGDTLESARALGKFEALVVTLNGAPATFKTFRELIAQVAIIETSKKANGIG